MARGLVRTGYLAKGKAESLSTRRCELGEARLRTNKETKPDVLTLHYLTPQATNHHKAREGLCNARGGAKKWEMIEHGTDDASSPYKLPASVLSLCLGVGHVRR